MKSIRVCTRYAIFGASFYILCMSNVACLSPSSIRPSARTAMNSLGDVNLQVVWANVKPFAALVAAEESFSTFAIYPYSRIVARRDEVQLKGRVLDGHLISLMPYHVLSVEEAHDLIYWFDHCREYGVTGFNNQLSDYYQIFLNNDVAFRVLREPVPEKLTVWYNSLSQPEITPRGEIFKRITDGVYLETRQQ